MMAKKRHSRPTKNGRRAEDIQEISQSAWLKVGELWRLANKGSLEAAAELHKITATAVIHLMSLSEQRPALVRPVARQKIAWPVIDSLHPHISRANQQLFKSLELGADTQLNLSEGKRFNLDLPANRVARHLVGLASQLKRAPMDKWKPADWRYMGPVGKQSERVAKSDHEQLRQLEAWGQRGAGKSLPALTKTTASQWRKPIRELLRLAYGSDFDGHPDMAELREQVSRRATTAEKKPGTKGTISERMIESVQQALVSIAAL